MSRIAEIESAIRELSVQELSEFRKWFIEFDEDAWDRQIEEDAKSGKLDWLAEEARREFAEGKTTEL